MQRTLADACVRSHADNEVRIRHKAQWSAMAMWFLFAEATLLNVAVLIPMFSAG